MKYLLALFGFLFSLWLLSCSDTTKPNQDQAILKGTVYYLDVNNNPVPLSDVLITSTDYFVQTRTDVYGGYQLSITLSKDTQQDQVVLQASRAGFKAQQVLGVAVKGETTTVPDIVLEKIVADTSNPVFPDSVSGDAAHIEVFGSHASRIYVQTSGLKETARINFLVTDAQGRAVDREHRVRVNFRILNGPGGGEYVEPDTMSTQNGLVFTVLNSGTVAGPVQLEAYAEVDGQTIRTIPVRIAIYGGLPDPRWFSLGIAQRNIAGRVVFGITDDITAFVGDKFSNPVAPGTIVYFSTDYGIVEGAAITDELGRATVRYMSAAPLPPNPLDSSFAHITAWTFEDTLGEDIISTRGKILLSDATAPISISPSTFQYDSVGSAVSFVYTVADIWGNPLVPGTRIKVQTTKGKLFGDVDIELRDYIFPGPGSTQFAFTWAAEDTIKTRQVYISLTVDSPPLGNGYQSLQVLGVKR